MPSEPVLLPLSSASVLTPHPLDRRERQAVTMLVEEVEKRSRILWPVVDRPEGAGPHVVVGRGADLARIDPAWGPAGSSLPAEGFRLHRCGSNVVVAGNDSRGILYGIGALLRSLRASRELVGAPAALDVTTAPRTRLRGHQLGYRDKTNSYDGWDLPQWEQYIRDLAIFGANAIELIPPRSDDKPDSVHFPLPPLRMMVGVSRIADDYGLDVWIWYPAMDEDYSEPSTVSRALEEWGGVFEALPRVNAVFVPGGDPGKSKPAVLMALMEKQVQTLRRFHPGAEMWMSPQGFGAERMEEWLAILRREHPSWLAGVVHGPWVHMTVSAFRELVPQDYALRVYPDITHTINCQLPVPGWDPAFALTEGREPINPRPLDQAAIFAHMRPGTVGFITYSEGCNDDVNKAVWSALGWDPERDVETILQEYSRAFIAEAYASDFAQGLLALERNWRGPLIGNRSVETTLQQFQAMEESAAPSVLKNWRFQQALYRAYYDAYVRTRLIHETAAEETALHALREASSRGGLAAVAEAQRALADERPVALGWRTRIHQLAEALFQSVHMQLSVRLYRGQEEVRGANLDGLDYPLSNAPWLRDQLAAIPDLQDEGERLERIRAIVDWSNPGPGGFYDDLGAGAPSIRLPAGLAYAEDPAFLRTASRRYPYRKNPAPVRLSWRGMTGTLADVPFGLHYRGLDPDAAYRVRVVYSAEQPQVRVRLTANGIEVHPWIIRPQPQAILEFDVPREATRDRDLELTWQREPGKGGAGRGCELCEVWLSKR